MSCEFCEFFRKNYSAKHLHMAVLEYFGHVPAKRYMLKVNNRNTGKGQKYVQI